MASRKSERIDESHPQLPINPNHRTKLMVEQALADFDTADGLKSVRLRYFNAAGADPGGQLGEWHEPEAHPIALVLQVASGRHSHISVFGQKCDTPDGTCARNDVQVKELCEGRWLAVQGLMAVGSSEAFNLGNGSGFSVQQVIDTARRVTGQEIQVQCAARRAGDPARLVADAAAPSRCWAGGRAMRRWRP